MKERVVRRRNYRKVGLVGLLVFVMVFSFAFLARKNGKIEENAEAADLSSFDAGYIISDYQMTNYKSMSEAEIQKWLTAKNACSNTSETYYRQLSAGSVYKWHFENGHFICLSEERFGNNDDEIGFQYSESAAHIIWQAAQDYKINPKVLLVLLEKETGLITDPIPNNGDYRKATGYGCPDTAACSSQYYGFKNQVRNAAELFRIVMDGNSSYYPIGNNFVQYNPNAACGGSIVKIRNLATSALYRYTPYQPNAGALAAGYGTAPCGAYGNRNFYLYFEDWFGNIHWDGWPSMAVALQRNRVQSEGADYPLTYQAHVEHYGWLPQVNGGEMAGTAGYGARMEAVSLKLGNNATGIEYQVHVKSKGWLGYVKDGAMSGTTGEGLQIEALQVRLTGEMAKLYDVYYRVHAAGIGWMDWVMNDEIAGTVGEGRQIEAMQVKLVKKVTEEKLDVNYSLHTAGLAWMEWVKNGAVGGTTGQARQVEALKIEIKDGAGTLIDGVTYQAHVAGIGWMDWVKNGVVGGTTGQARRVEAVRIKLSDSLAKKYDIYYRVHAAGIGWMEWVKNGELGGTTGQARQLEAIEIKLVDK